MKIIFNVHNRRNTGPVEKIIELVLSLKKINSNNQYLIFCTSDYSRFKIEKEDYQNITIVSFPDLLVGKLRQGIDLYNSFFRILYLVKHSDFDILHSIDARPVVSIPSFFSKFFLRKPLFLNWWDYSGKGGVSEQKLGIFYSKTIGLLEYSIDKFMRKISDVNFVVSKGLLDKIVQLNPSANNYLVRVGADNKNFHDFHENFPFNSNMHCNKYEYAFYCGSLSSKEKSFLIKVAKVLDERNSPVKIVIAGTNISGDNYNLINLGRLKNFQDILNLIYYSKFCLLPLKDNIHNNLRWPSKISDYFSLGKMVVSTPLQQLQNLSEDFIFFSNSSNVNEYVNEINRVNNLTTEQRLSYEKKSLFFFQKHLSNEKIASFINSIYYDFMNKRNR